MGRLSGLVPEKLRDRNVVLWDGECGFCRQSIKWLSQKAPGKFAALPYQEQADWLPAQIFQDCKNQLYLRTQEGKYLAGGDAVIELFRLLGCRYTSLILGLPGFRQLTRLVYKLVAKNRRFISSFFIRS